MKDGKSKLLRYLKYILIDIVTAAVVSIFLITYVASAYRVDGNSMQSVLQDKERIIIYKWPVGKAEIHRGDIVVLKKPDELHRNIIKRVIGLPGETVEIKKGDVYVNGVMLNEPYLKIEKDIIYRSMNMDSIKVPQGGYFVLGDNRALSHDSRYFGSVPRNLINGVTIFRYWPFSKIGKVE